MSEGVAALAPHGARDHADLALSPTTMGTSAARTLSNPAMTSSAFPDRAGA
ncbi:MULTISPECIES: hypothetical protein [Methylobacterium]|uniref:hypothetical protein n=1 Tax=Methylobacterium TaxID=407 RepID=UPI0012E840DF|nr:MULTISPECIES: hypothetical protein [Methylobacterium]